VPIKPRMYVLVRKDLSTVYGAVQGAHAVAQYALEHPEEFKQWGNEYLIFLGVRNLMDLRYWGVRLKENCKVCSVFREPDLDNQETAIACYDTVPEFFQKLHMA
jgi:hypothetical protein